MVSVDATACLVAGSLFNVAGLLVALSVWDIIFAPNQRRQTKRLLWIVPFILVSAWLETALRPTGTTVAAPDSINKALLFRHIGMDLLAWATLTLVVVWGRQRMRQAQPTSSPFSPSHSTPAADILNAELEPSVKRFLDAADHAEIAAITALYDPDFTCVRVADAGGFVRLSREQMLAFFQSTLDAAASKTAASREGESHAAVTVRETTVHHVEVVGDIGLVLLTRIKNIGSGWEPMFYSLVWRKQDENWHLLREFVHQRTIPRW